MELSAAELTKAIVAAGLSSAENVEELWASVAENPPTGREFAILLIKQNCLTNFQARELLTRGKTPLILGSYELLDRIGAGGMGRVFRARHRHMDRLVALKLLAEKLDRDPAAVQRFRREVKAVARLSHPNVVQAYDAGVDKGQWFLVMELVDGKDLGEIVKERGQLPIPEAVEYIRQAAQGLAFAHENGIVHRDIKPENLLHTKSGAIKILDLGLARFSEGDGLTLDGEFMGTIDYTAPEQSKNARLADARADIYSLGCTLFKLLTGRRMFDGDTAVNRLLAHQNQEIPSLLEGCPNASPQLVATFERMVQKRPEDRFATMTEVDAALRSVSQQLNWITEIFESDVAEPPPARPPRGAPPGEPTPQNLPVATLIEDPIEFNPGNAGRPDGGSHSGPTVKITGETSFSPPPQPAKLPGPFRPETRRPPGSEVTPVPRPPQHHPPQNESSPLNAVLLVFIGIAVGFVLFVILGCAGIMWIGSTAGDPPSKVPNQLPTTPTPEKKEVDPFASNNSWRNLARHDGVAADSPFRN